MAYDEELAARVRAALARRRNVTERAMFGGLSFMVRGKMACGVLRQDLVVRVGRERYDELLAHPHARPMDFTGKPMRGFIYVAPAGSRTAVQLRWWIERALEHNRSAPGASRGRRGMAKAQGD